MAGLAWCVGASPLSAQVALRSRAMEIELTGRVHTQFNSSSVDGEMGSAFLVRRVRLAAEVKVSEVVSGKVEPDFAGNRLSLKDAYLRLDLDSGLRVTLGNFKRPFDVFELTSSTETLVIERAGEIRGVDACAGPGGVCSLSRLTEKLQYSDRDVGLELDGSFTGGRLRYAVAVTNGAGSGEEDENGTKSFAGRVAFAAAPDLVVAANAGVHDYRNAVRQDDAFAGAAGVDVEWGTFAGGPHVQAGIVWGDNWKALDRSGEERRFVAWQGIATYRRRIEASRVVEALEPVARVSWGDGATDEQDGEGWLLTPGFVVHFTGRNKIAANLDFWVPGDGDGAWSLKLQSYLHF
ncbi:MAG: hypothetical protein HY704_05205 [Gemmatimonadetes bacterium]|nr:hypothetical protein [Gemmatimonadota bacterium]